MKQEKGNRTEIVYVKLKEMIHSGYLRPNQTLNLRGLARQFQTSLTPVNHALARLAEEGLVVKKPNKSSIVATMSMEEFKRFSMKGALLEGMAAYLATSRMTSAEIGKMKKLIEKMNEAKIPEDSAKLKKINEEFHGTYIRCCNDKEIIMLIKENSWRLYRYYFLVLSFVGAFPGFVEEHQMIVNRFKKGDPVLVREAVENHIYDSGEKVLQLAELGLIR